MFSMNFMKETLISRFNVKTLPMDVSDFLKYQMENVVDDVQEPPKKRGVYCL